ncbi:hypothetical protein KL949_001851 [Ogataea haglerorum]|nr:hypothetical protein KL915_001174 [Ogataea haglerorum]KAG7700485.1 hypothetical protein KL951_000600 [Ogataea haglerorum]KAG7709924.1 hypothetical protein KL914_000834 [Ogataea haglerorum]KAG7711296.1 hypothetical protein KL950_001262 [Ogataea haglerorum]KAG7720593.1 hypothetical protein KL913_001493 [Ogataea haglerorum]
MKQRVTAFDIRVLVKEIEHAIKGHRLQNVYNLVTNPRSFLLKFSVPDSKANLVVENGFKVYLTEFQRPTAPEPSSFVVKLRKHLKSRRLSNIKQVGHDRVVVLEFGDGMYYLVLEFFSAGNIILLDSDRKILSLFRLVEEHENNDRYAVGVTYGMFDGSLFEEHGPSGPRLYTAAEIYDWATSASENSSKVPSVAKLVFLNAAYLSSDLIQIQLSKNGVDPASSSAKIVQDEELLAKVAVAVNSCEQEFHRLTNLPAGELSGYIVGKHNPFFKPEEDASYENLEYVYDEFHPFEPVHKRMENTRVEEVKGYNRTLDKFFSTLESSKAVLKIQQQQANAAKRLQTVKNEHMTKLQRLEEQQAVNYRKGELITLHSVQIEQCKQSIQALLDQQMDWTNIEKLVAMEQKRRNPIANMIKLPLNLAQNEITVLLPDVEEQSDSDSDSESEETQKRGPVAVAIDLSLSAYANATRYFDAMRAAVDKQNKTKNSASIAIKNTERTIEQDLKRMQKKAQEPSGLKQIRAKFWFEKFWWFITSDNHLCIAGRDDTQVDLIYYRYFDKNNDVLVSNDLDGLKVVVKNPFKNKDIPPSTLLQAGIFSLSASKAWDNKMVTSPWMVKGSQVSKKDFDGSIVPAGMLNIQGEKTFLPPCQLVMGFGLLWLGDEETTRKYRDLAKSRIQEVGLEVAQHDDSVDLKIQELTAMLEKLGGVEEEDAEVKDEETAVPAESSETEEPASSAEITINTTVRGKKSKLKKIKQKYKDQDEEERRLRMEALGTLKQKRDQPEKSEPQPENKGSDRKTRKKQQDIRLLKKLVSELEESAEESDATPYNEIISGLIPAPKESDSIVNCILVFAPYNALSKYTYKVKVQPGPLKKGKALSEAVRALQLQTQSLKKDNAPWADSKNLIEHINQQDALLTITASKLKLAGAAADKGKTSARKSKK